MTGGVADADDAGSVRGVALLQDVGDVGAHRAEALDDNACAVQLEACILLRHFGDMPETEAGRADLVERDTPYLAR